MSDDAWEVVIVNEVDAMLETLDFCDAFELGRLDALDGKPCRPGQYERPTNQVEYLCGWRDGMHVEDTEDLIEGKLDAEWHARGQW